MDTVLVMVDEAELVEAGVDPVLVILEQVMVTEFTLVAMAAVVIILPVVMLERTLVVAVVAEITTIMVIMEVTAVLVLLWFVYLLKEVSTQSLVSV